MSATFTTELMPATRRPWLETANSHNRPRLIRKGLLRNASLFELQNISRIQASQDC